MITLNLSAFVAAPRQTVMEVYADYRNWSSFIPTIKAVHLLRREGDTLVLAVDHDEGHVINELLVRWPEQIELWESKRFYEGRFWHHFETVEGARASRFGPRSVCGRSSGCCNRSSTDMRDDESNVSRSHM